MVRMPAIVVRDHCHCGITDFRFPCELRFGDVGHSNHFETQLPVDVGLGESGKLRSFHADIRAAAVDAHVCGVACCTEHVRELSAHRLVEADMCDSTIAKER